MPLVMFVDVPVDAEFYILDHMADEVRYIKTNPFGIAGMCCNAQRKSDKADCWVPLDKEVHYNPPK